MREEQPRAERKPSGEKYVPPPAKRNSQGDKEKEKEKEKEKPEKPEKPEKQEKRFESAAIERRRISSDSWEETTPMRAAPTTPPGAAATAKIQEKEPTKVRSDLIRAVFRACDTNGDDWLGESEFRNIARFYGFDGSDEEWSREFKKLCEEKKVDPKRGIGQTLFGKMLNEDAGLLATNDELRKWLKKLEDNNKKTGGSKEAKAQGGAPREEEGDEFYHKLKRTVNWYNKHGNLADPIRLNQVADVLAEIKPNQAMKILYDLDTATTRRRCRTPPIGSSPRRGSGARPTSSPRARGMERVKRRTARSITRMMAKPRSHRMFLNGVAKMPMTKTPRAPTKALEKERLKSLRRKQTSSVRR